MPDVEEWRLGTLHHPTLRLRQPLALAVLRAHDAVTVWHPGLEEAGYGPYLTAAIEDFERTLIELFQRLSDDRTRLGPELQRVWQQLQQYIEER